MKWHLAWRIALCTVGLFAGCASVPVREAPPVRAPAAVAPFPTAPVYSGPVVELSGDGASIGAAHGKALAQPIQFLHDYYLKVYLGSASQRFLALGAARLFESYFRPEHRSEIQALARASNLDEREAVLAQCFLDLSSMSACSTITLPASASPDHVARFGRNLEFTSFDVADKYSTVFVYRPDGAYPFVSIGWPGMIGVLSGMNEQGLALANMEVSRRPRLPGAMPYTLLYRTVLEHCRTVAEAIDLIQNTRRQTANNLMLMDAAGDRAVVEIRPDAVVVRRAPPAEPLVSTNHQRGGDCSSTGRCWRYDRLHASGEAQFGSIGLHGLESMLEQVSPGEETLQSMVFEPSNRVIYLSTGKNASAGTFYRIDLNSYFR